MKLSRLLFTFALMAVSFCVQAVETGQTVRLVNNGLSVFVENSSLDQNKCALLWTETNVNAQRWTLTAKTNGTFLVQNDYTSYYLAGITSGSAGYVGQTSKSSANSRGSWEFVPIEGTTNQYHIYQGTSRKYALASLNPIEGDTLKIINLENITPDPSCITWTVEVVEPMAKEFTKDKRDDMMEKWKARAYKQAGTGWVIGGGGWWGDAEMFEIVLDALETTGDQKYATMFENLYTNFIARNQETWYQKGVNGYNEYNDDIAWMCIACVRAYLLTGTAKYRNTAKKNFDGMFARADCYGNDLLQWKHNSGQGTNSCINGPAAVCACYLAIAQADTSYYQKARKTYMAERRTLFEMSGGKPTGKIWDSYDQGTGNINYWASTYNQGTNLGAAIMLYNHYGEQMFKDDADAIIRWSEANMANNHGIIHVCQTVQGDLCGFKGIMLRYLRMYAESFNAPSHYDWIAKNAYHAWNNRNSSGITSSAWLTKAEENFIHPEWNNDKKAYDYKNFGNEGNMTCVSAAFNCHLGAVDYHDAYAKNEAEDFNFVRNASVVYEGNGDEDDGGMVGPMKTNHYIGYRSVDFGDKPASHIELRVKLSLNMTTINVYLDQPNATNGTLLCSIKGSELSATKTWETVQKMINQPVTGVHNVYFVSTSSGQTSLNWWQFHSLNNIYADLTNGSGTLSTSFETSDVSAIIDGDITTALTSDIETGTETWIEYKTSTPMHVYGYQFYSGNDNAGRPAGWSLQGSNDGENWETLHTEAEANISVSGQCYRAEIESTTDYTHYRLLFNLAESQTKLSVTEWQLLGRLVEENELTADGGSITEGFESLIDHIGSTPITTPLTAIYHPAGNYTLSSYSITAGAKDSAPTSWKLEGSANGNTGWKLIDQQTDATFPYDNSTNVYRVNPEAAYLYYRLTVNGEEAQLAQLQLFGSFDFGHYFAEATTIATIVSSDGNDALPLIDKNGNTYADLSGNDLFWNIATPIPVRVVGYSFISADDAELDPQNITLYGCDESGTETQLATKAPTFPARGYRQSYTVSTTKTFKHFKLKVSQTTASSVRLADFELYGTAIAETNDPNLVVPLSVEASSPGLSTTEAISRINDGNRVYHYRSAFNEPVSITYSMADSVCINAYSITASKNELTRDPADWVFEGSNDGETWTLLDSKSGETFSHRYATQFYLLETTQSFNTYRLTVTATNGANQLQIGELQLLSITPVDPTGIAKVNTSLNHNDNIYNLAGQRLSKPQKGINIINGRKVLIK